MDESIYDISLSFAGEDRKYVEAVAEALVQSGVKVFYDRHEEAELWGKDLYLHLDKIYRKQSRYCIVFASKSYARKLWTSHELRSAQARALEKAEEYILPARFDDTEIPGLPSTVGYVSLENLTPADFSDLVLKKIGFSSPSVSNSDRTKGRSPHSRILSAVVMIVATLGIGYAVLYYFDPTEPIEPCDVPFDDRSLDCMFEKESV